MTRSFSLCLVIEELGETLSLLTTSFRVEGSSNPLGQIFRSEPDYLASVSTPGTNNHSKLIFYRVLGSPSTHRCSRAADSTLIIRRIFSNEFHKFLYAAFKSVFL